MIGVMLETPLWTQSRKPLQRHQCKVTTVDIEAWWQVNFWPVATLCLTMQYQETAA